MKEKKDPGRKHTISMLKIVGKVAEELLLPPPSFGSWDSTTSLKLNMQ